MRGFAPTDFTSRSPFPPISIFPFPLDTFFISPKSSHLSHFSGARLFPDGVDAKVNCRAISAVWLR